MKRILAALAALCLLAGAALSEVPQFDRETYPNVDGSTAMLPLSSAGKTRSRSCGSPSMPTRRARSPKPA